ncbi:hypothetical protein KOL64_20135 [Providencia rettgeri]|uniref:Uncharacterized protein n=1 Tax=Providencia rettgeri TaxID=587 RepID=A0AAJ6K5J5_PRORE|nr:MULTISPECIES: hypothetical protein [Providencia]WHT81567.1 hypothetical protein KOL65_20095 [Providencia rettgeri]WHT95655.1 hypothetical protein KOF27_20145 [Providencia rettgeri]WJM88184.1 hypothetical protein KOL64_20135 [Providencia rettgeri]
MAEAAFCNLILFGLVAPEENILKFFPWAVLFAEAFDIHKLIFIKSEYS